MLGYFSNYVKIYSSISTALLQNIKIQEKKYLIKKT